MSSHELAKKLLELPDVMVVRNGYEGGVTEVTEVYEPKKLHLNVNSAWYYGKHEFHEDRFECEHCENGVSHTTQAIHIG